MTAAKLLDSILSTRRSPSRLIDRPSLFGWVIIRCRKEVLNLAPYPEALSALVFAGLGKTSGAHQFFNRGRADRSMGGQGLQVLEWGYEAGRRFKSHAASPL